MSSSLEIVFAGQRLVLDAELALYWPDQQALIVSDLHLEKATFLTQFGSPLAPYDTLDTLSRLEKLVARYRPKTLILLGDSFHDRRAWERLESSARAHWQTICGSVETCHLVEGNHDVDLNHDLSTPFIDEVAIAGIIFRHEPGDGPLAQVIGHFHPKLRTSLRGHRLTGKCFAVNDKMLIMPAFGTFTGGLNISDPVFSDLAQGQPFQPYVIYGKTISPISGR
jgi:DNA ligase-associated metallophosphoesterase